MNYKLLEKYEVYKFKNSFNFNRIMKKNDFDEKDYLLLNVAQQNQKKGSCGQNEKDYFLHPNAFKILLMRSLNTKKYAKYYIFLENIIKYYNDYQIELKNHKINLLKNKIIEKDGKIGNLSIKIDKQSLEIQELLENSRKTHEKLDNAHIKLDNIGNNLFESGQAA